MKPIHWLMLCVCIISAGCKPSPEQQATMTATAMTATAAAWTPTSTATITVTPTATPTVTLTPTSTRKPTRTPTVTPTIDPLRYYAPDNTYSLILPEGWHESDMGINYPILSGPEVGDAELSMFFTQQVYHAGIIPFYMQFQDNLRTEDPNLKHINWYSRKNPQGLDYYRWEYSMTFEQWPIHGVTYFFNSNGWILTISYTRPIDRGAEYDAAVDAAIGTLIFYR